MNLIFSTRPGLGKASGVARGKAALVSNCLAGATGASAPSVTDLSQARAYLRNPKGIAIIRCRGRKSP
jgi:hypothetical protein